jgi:hypothetical protein
MIVVLDSDLVWLDDQDTVSGCEMVPTPWPGQLFTVQKFSTTYKSKPKCNSARIFCELFLEVRSTGQKKVDLQYLPRRQPSGQLIRLVP